MEKMHVKMTVNGKNVDLLTEPRTLLIHALREELGITGPHVGCSSSHWGACTVDMNGMSVISSCCVVIAPIVTVPPSMLMPFSTSTPARSIR